MFSAIPFSGSEGEIFRNDLASDQLSCTLRTMIKNILMMLGVAAVFALGTACFGLSSKADKHAPAFSSTNSSSTVPR